MCVDICVHYEDRVLLIKRNTEPAKNEWWFPGGRIFKGETLRDCAIRKAKEEVGINDCEYHYCGHLHTSETQFPSGPNNIPIHSINVCIYLILNKMVDVKLDKYSISYKWVDEIDEKLHPYIKEVLRSVLPKENQLPIDEYFNYHPY